jgi:hypothetical protein
VNAPSQLGPILSPIGPYRKPRPKSSARRRSMVSIKAVYPSRWTHATIAHRLSNRPFIPSASLCFCALINPVTRVNIITCCNSALVRQVPMIEQCRLPSKSQILRRPCDGGASICCTRDVISCSTIWGSGFALNGSGAGAAFGPSSKVKATLLPVRSEASVKTFRGS